MRRTLDQLTPVLTPSRKSARRSVSAPALFVQPPVNRYMNEQVPVLDAADTYSKVIGYLSEPLPTYEEDEPLELARVYIFQDPDRPSHLKIGFSKDPESRMKKVQKECNFARLEILFKSRMILTSWARKVETLTHYELGAFRRSFTCGGCRKSHREYFEIAKEVAKRTIERWIALLEMHPYSILDGTFNKKCTLTPQYRPYTAFLSPG